MYEISVYMCECVYIYARGVTPNIEGDWGKKLSNQRFRPRLPQRPVLQKTHPEIGSELLDPRLKIFFLNNNNNKSKHLWMRSEWRTISVLYVDCPAIRFWELGMQERHDRQRLRNFFSSSVSQSWHLTVKDISDTTHREFYFKDIVFSVISTVSSGNEIYPH